MITFDAPPAPVVVTPKAPARSRWSRLVGPVLAVFGVLTVVWIIDHTGGSTNVTDVENPTGFGNGTSGAGVGNVTNVTGFGDASNVTDAGNVTNATGFGDASNVTDAGDASNVTDVGDAANERAACALATRLLVSCAASNDHRDSCELSYVMKPVASSSSSLSNTTNTTESSNGASAFAFHTCYYDALSGRCERSAEACASPLCPHPGVYRNQPLCCSSGPWDAERAQCSNSTHSTLGESCTATPRCLSSFETRDSYFGYMNRPYCLPNVAPGRTLPLDGTCTPGYQRWAEYTKSGAHYTEGTRDLFSSPSHSGLQVTNVIGQTDRKTGSSFFRGDFDPYSAQLYDSIVIDWSQTTFQVWNTQKEAGIFAYTDGGFDPDAGPFEIRDPFEPQGVLERSAPFAAYRVIDGDCGNANKWERLYVIKSENFVTARYTFGEHVRTREAESWYLAIGKRRNRTHSDASSQDVMGVPVTPKVGDSFFGMYYPAFAASLYNATSDDGEPPAGLEREIRAGPGTRHVYSNRDPLVRSSFSDDFDFCSARDVFDKSACYPYMSQAYGYFGYQPAHFSSIYVEAGTYEWVGPKRSLVHDVQRPDTWSLTCENHDGPLVLLPDMPVQPGTVYPMQPSRIRVPNVPIAAIIHSDYTPGMALPENFTCRDDFIPFMANLLQPEWGNTTVVFDGLGLRAPEIDTGGYMTYTCDAPNSSTITIGVTTTVSCATFCENMVANCSNPASFEWGSNEGSTSIGLTASCATLNLETENATCELTLDGVWVSSNWYGMGQRFTMTEPACDENDICRANRQTFPFSPILNGSECQASRLVAGGLRECYPKDDLWVLRRATPYASHTCTGADLKQALDTLQHIDGNYSAQLQLQGNQSIVLERLDYWDDPGAVSERGDVGSGHYPSTFVDGRFEKAGSFTIVYTSISGESANVTRHVVVEDTTSPTNITLANPVVYVEQYTGYVEEYVVFGAIGINDDLLCDMGEAYEAGECEASGCTWFNGTTCLPLAITGTVNVTVPGNYTLTYTISDKAGNTLALTRTVVVTPFLCSPFDALPVCAGPNEYCIRDDSCDPANNLANDHGGLGCGAGGETVCRFCGYADLYACFANASPG